MIKSYNQTMMMSNEKLRKATVRVIVYDKTKYEAEDGIEVRYTGLVSWDIVAGGTEAKAIEANTDASNIDENHEYLVLHFEDDTTATFRNSHVDFFIR